MTWHVSYRKGEEMGFRAVVERAGAIKLACDFLDDGYDILRVIESNTTERVSPQELSLNHSKRKAIRPQ